MLVGLGVLGLVVVVSREGAGRFVGVRQGGGISIGRMQAGMKKRMLFVGSSFDKRVPGA